MRQLFLLRSILSLTVGLLSSSALSAQGKKEIKSVFEDTETTLPEDVISISIGDKIPDLKFNNVFNYKSKTARLSDFKGKAVLIDFWATWCISCIAHFPKLDSLQAKFKDRLQVLLVNSKGTGDDEKKIAFFFEKRRKKNGERYQLTSIADDILLQKFFPHRFLPHYAWIGPDGIVRAITSSKHVTATNINDLIENGKLHLPVKKDLDPTKPLFLSDDMSLDDLMQYSIFVKGQVEGLGSSYKSRRSGETIRGKSMTNMPLLEMYKRLAIELMDDFHDKRVYIEVSDSSKLIFDKKKSEKDTWNKQNFYSYELILPETETDNLYNYMLEDINRYSDFHAEIKKIKTKCLVLIRTSEIDKLQSRGGKSEFKLYREEDPYIKNLPLARIMWKLNEIQDTGLLIINETNYKEPVDIEFKGALDNMEQLLKELNRYDLTLVEAIRELDMFVITNKIAKQLSESKQISSK